MTPFLVALLAACTFDSGGVATPIDGGGGDLRLDDISVVTETHLVPDGLVADGTSPDGMPSDSDAHAEGLLRDDAEPSDAIPEGFPRDDAQPSDATPEGLLQDYGPHPDTLSPDTLSPDTLSPDSADPCATCDPALGCNTVSGRCYLLLPSTLTESEVTSLPQATTNCDLSPGKNKTFDIDTDDKLFATCTGVISEVFTQSNGPDLRVYVFPNLRIGAHATIRFTGDNAVLLYAYRTIKIEGNIDATAHGANPGPGGKASGASDGDDGECWFTDGEGKGGKNSSFYDSGGGGGAHRQDGAKGGNSAMFSMLAGGAGGSATNAPTALAPLFGGCGGGAGSGDNDNGGGGGAGGGSLHLVAGSQLLISGKVNAGGGGGRGGQKGSAGGGGGGGGQVLLEAVTITVSGVVAANGGGGGAGAKDANDTKAKAGRDGQPSDQPAPGGASGGGNSGHGGNGGAKGAAATNGETKTNAGGGGGGIGRIDANAANSTLGGIISPTQTTTSTLNKY
ncbi:MAG: hypothetical protein KAI47_14940 [Deltaproteobacteria bacterium]|nr:hypothetical protein [Deltaproteobacteria bacterium]